MQKPIFEIKKLTYKTKGKTVLSIGKFEIHRGIIYAVAGQPGAGKTTLLEILAQARRATDGSFSYDGEPESARAFRRKHKEEVCFLPQAGRRACGTVEKYMRKHIRTASWSADSARNRLKTVSKQMNLTDKLTRKAQHLSPGELRWVDLAICLASDAKVLIIDEVERHLSYDDMDLVKRLIQRKCNYEGTTVILSTLNPMTIRRMTGVSVTLDRGRIAMIRSVREGGRGRRTQGSGGNNNSRTPRSSEDRPRRSRPSEDRPRRSRPSEDRPRKSRPSEDRPRKSRPSDESGRKSGSSQSRSGNR